MIFKGHTDATEGVSKSGNAWRKVTGIFETVEHFPKTIAVTGLNAVCEDILNCKPGRLYIVDFDIESRSWTDPKTNVEKWFTDAKAWKVTPAVQAVAPGIQPGQRAIPAGDMANFDNPIPPVPGYPPAGKAKEKDGDLPF